MDNQQVRLLWGLIWLGGIVDGEGSLGINKVRSKNSKSTEYRYVTRIQIANSDPEIINGVVSVLEGLGLAYYLAIKPPQKEKKKMYLINIHGYKRSYRFLKVIRKYLVGDKKSLADKMIRYIESRLDRRSFNAPYTRQEISMAEDILRHIKNNKVSNLNDHTPDFPYGGMKIWSGLHSDMQRLAEMTSPAAKGE